MTRSAVLPFVALALVAACSDTKPDLGRSSAGLVGVTSNPPPPAITGYVDGDFALAADFSASASSGVTSPSLQRTGGAPSLETTGQRNIFFHFQTDQGELNGTRAQTAFWINLQGLPSLPPNPCFLTSSLRPRVTWDGTQIVGTGVIYAVDLRNNGIWFVDLGQLSRPSIYNPFIRLTATDFKIEPKVTPRFCFQTGLDGNGNPTYQAFNGNRVNLRYHQGVPVP